ncbi:MAG TPA: hypothetical protein PKA64_12920 [Myxococcota bacterium]|nr:hypothetical protein [Myxococcota bacterium]
MTLRFDQALERALAFMRGEARDLGQRRLVVRDLRGRIRVLLSDRDAPRKEVTRALADDIATARPALHAALGAWSSGEGVVLGDMAHLLDPDAAWSSSDALRIDDRTRLLERTLIGQDWRRSPLPDAPPHPPRATLFGLKGGVGRTTALALWARRLAAVGKRVLIVDLDLEAPGLGHLTLPHDATPTFGVVDWFVESAAGQGDDLLRDLAGRSRLGADVEGEVLVVPAAGAQPGAYLSKLARVYQGVDGQEFGDRLHALIEGLEREWEPDVVLLDSRAGLHDIAAVALTRLHALCLLFAVHTPQTWSGYRLLFQHWQAHLHLSPAVAAARKNLQLVAGQVPETRRDEYLQGFRDAAYRLMIDTLYDEVGTDAPNDAWSFDLTEDGAPHQPLPIYWSRVFQDFNPIDRPDEVTPAQIDAAYGGFLTGATDLLPADP